MGQKSSRHLTAPQLSGGGEDVPSIIGFVTDPSTTSAMASDLNAWQDELVRQTRSMHKVANITYDEFLANIKQLNEISSQYLDANGKQLVFAVKKGSDSTILWKATVRIACVKIDANSKEIDSYKSLGLKQFLQIYYRLKNQVDAVVQATDDADCAKVPNSVAQSSLLDDIEPAAAVENCSDECVICLERKPDLILPCAHSYCLPCIEQWNVDHKTCPVCRETLSSTDDGWGCFGQTGLCGDNYRDSESFVKSHAIK